MRERELTREVARTLDIVWFNLQHGLVRQVADFFTDLFGPIKNLQDATSTPADETAYQQAADTFLVSFLTLFSLPVLLVSSILNINQFYD